MPTPKEEHMHDLRSKPVCLLGRMVDWAVKGQGQGHCSLATVAAKQLS